MEKQEQQEGLVVAPAKVIEGWADGITASREPDEIASITLFTDKRFDELVPATLVIGEKAWPESKVRELLRDVAATVSGTYNPAWLTNLAAKHKITL